jgi:hypothetical protein
MTPILDFGLCTEKDNAPITQPSPTATQMQSPSRSGGRPHGRGRRRAAYLARRGLDVHPRPGLWEPPPPPRLVPPVQAPARAQERAVKPEEEGGGRPHDELDLGTGMLDSEVGKVNSEM